MASILKVDTIQDQSGNNIINENADTITIGASGDTITVPTGATIDLSNATQTGVGGNNAPAFFARKTTTQSLSNDTNTLVTFDTEDFDTDSAFASSRFTVPSGKAGKYFIYSACYFQPSAEANLSYAQANIYKNGSIYQHVNNDFRSYRIFTFTSINSTIIDLAEGDYIEIYAFTSGTSTVILEDDNGRVDRMNVFYGYKLIGV